MGFDDADNFTLEIISCNQQINVIKLIIIKKIQVAPKYMIIRFV